MKNILKFFIFICILSFFTGCFNSKSEEIQVSNSGNQNEEKVNSGEIEEEKENEKEFYLGVDISNFDDNEKSYIKENFSLDENFNLLFTNSEKIIKFFDSKKLKIFSSDYIIYDNILYNYNGDIINKEVDIENFKVLEEDLFGKKYLSSYAKDKNNIYNGKNIDEKWDSESFELFSIFKKDKNNVEILGKTIENKGFEYLNSEYFYKNNGKIYNILKGDKILFIPTKFDTDSFKVLFNDRKNYIIKDKNGIYLGKEKLEKFDFETFENIEGDYFKDKNGIYLYNPYYKKFKNIDGADLESFEIIKEKNIISKDKNYVYYDGERKNFIDAESFKIAYKVNDYDYIFKDKRFFYGEYLDILKVDYETFGIFKKNISILEKKFFKDKNYIYDEDMEIIEIEKKYTNEKIFPFINKENIIYIPNEKESVKIELNPENFEIIFSFVRGKYKKEEYYLYIKNIDGVFLINFKTLEIKKLKADYNSFKVLNQNHTIDKNSVYYQDEIIEGADIKTFEVLTEEHSKDKNNFYYEGKKVKEAN